MVEKIKNNISSLVSIISALIVLGGVFLSYSDQRGRINQMEEQQRTLEKRIDKQEKYFDDLQNDIKNILCKVSTIEGQLSLLKRENN